MTGAVVCVLSARAFLAVGWFWFLGTLMPVIGIEQVGTQARADRYTYLPMIGVYLMIVWLLKEAGRPLAQDPHGPGRRRGRGVRWRSARSVPARSAIGSTAMPVRACRQVTDKNWFAYNHIGIAYDAMGRRWRSGDIKAAEQLFDHVAETVPGAAQTP